LLRIVAGVALLGTEATFLSGHASAQEIDFGQIKAMTPLGERYRPAVASIVRSMHPSVDVSSMWAT
jgi:hypothetical protein